MWCKREIKRGHFSEFAPPQVKVDHPHAQITHITAVPADSKYHNKNSNSYNKRCTTATHVVARARLTGLDLQRRLRRPPWQRKVVGVEIRVLGSPAAGADVQRAASVELSEREARVDVVFRDAVLVVAVLGIGRGWRR